MNDAGFSPEGTYMTTERATRVPLITSSEQEDAMLEAIDRERGKHVDSAREYVDNVMKRVSARSVATTIIVEYRSDVQPALDAFVKHLVQLMITANEDGGDTATRAYVIANGMRIKLRTLEGNAAGYSSMTMDGARALRSELRGYNDRNEGGPLTLPDLYAAVDTVLSRKERERRDAHRRAARRVRGR